MWNDVHDRWLLLQVWRGFPKIFPVIYVFVSIVYWWIRWASNWCYRVLPNSFYFRYIGLQFLRRVLLVLWFERWGEHLRRWWYEWVVLLLIVIIQNWASFLVWIWGDTLGVDWGWLEIGSLRFWRHNLKWHNLRLYRSI